MAPEATAFLQRARILDATARSVAAAGFAGASVRAIHERAGVSRATFYEHFDGKEDAVVNAIEAVTAFAVPRVLATFRAEDGWAAGVQAALSTYLDIVDCDRAWAILYFVELPSAGPRAMERRDVAVEPVLRELEAGPRGSGVLGGGGLLAAVDGVVRWQISRQTPLSVRDHREELLRLVLPEAVGLEASEGAGPRAAGSRARAADPDRVGALIGGLEGELVPAELTEAIDGAVRSGDGMVLWRAALAFHDLRSRGAAYPRGLERRVLDGLENASFFGLPVSDMTDEWAVPTAGRRALRFVLDHPGCSGEEVRAGLGIAHLATVSRLMRQLEKAGLVRRQPRRGPANQWRCTDTGKHLVVDV